MSPCRIIGNAIVCGPNPKRHRCIVCDESGDILCDGPVGVQGKTCDAKLCRRCAMRVKPMANVVTVALPIDVPPRSSRVVPTPAVLDFCPWCANAMRDQRRKARVAMSQQP